MKAKLLIPVCFFIACQAFYDLFGKMQNTNWSIFYYSAQYLAWLVLIILIKKPTNKIKQIPYWILAVGLILYIAHDLIHINKPYIDYYNAVASYKSFILPISVMVTGLALYIFRHER